MGERKNLPKALSLPKSLPKPNLPKPTLPKPGLPHLPSLKPTLDRAPKLKPLAMPSAPAEEPWQLSLAGYLRQSTDLPALALKPLGLLDRYGEIAVSPAEVSFDGEDVPWEKVIRLEVRDVLDVVTDAALEREAEKIRSMLPPVPGRKWVVDHAMALFGDIAGSFLGRARGGDVVSTVVYRGMLGREKTLQAGVFASLVMAGWPDVRRSLTATARSHGADVFGEREEPHELTPASRAAELEASD
ncbi:MAG: hypothetical protein HOV83_10215 [Catenulispora sp.]|nr:hypothetical protein [Catenulispora sp.]